MHILAPGLYTTLILLLPSLAAGLAVALCWFLRAASESHCLNDPYYSAYKAVSSACEGGS